MNQSLMKELGIENSRMQKKLDIKYCSVPEKMRVECSGKIIKAHTISKCLGLSNLAIGGKVFGLPKPNLIEFNKNKGQVEIIEMGIQQASVLQCFCAKHDRELFSPIENEDFIVSSEQCFLLAYRALINEWYKSVQVAISDNICEKMKKDLRDSILPNVTFPSYLNQDEIIDSLYADISYVKETEWKKRDLNSDKEIFDGILISKNFSQIKHYIFEGEKSSDMVCCFTLNPDISFDNIQIQDYEKPDYLASIYINGISCKDKSYIIFSWIDDEYNNKIIENFFGKLRCKSNDHIENHLLEFILKNSENNFFSKKWYELLNRTQKKYLQNWIQPMSNRKLNYIDHKMRFMKLQKHYLLD